MASINVQSLSVVHNTLLEVYLPHKLSIILLLGVLPDPIKLNLNLFLLTFFAPSHVRAFGETVYAPEPRTN